MSVIDMLLDLFRDDSAQDELAEDPAGYLATHGLEGLTAGDVLNAMPGLCGALPPEQAEAVRAVYGLDGPSAGSASAGSAASAAAASVHATLPPPPAPDPGGDPVEQVLQQLNYFTTVGNTTQQHFEDNDVTNIDDRDTTVDNSVNQNITAFGDVNQDFDNDVVSGEGAVAAGDDAEVNTGDGAVQAGDDIDNATIATGDVEGSVFDDATDSVIGDDDQVISDSTMGAATFGSGDATNVEAENANLGDGLIVSDTNGDPNLNAGDGDFTQFTDSELDESVVGGGSVESNDIDVSADDGSSVAFGDGAESSAESQDVEVYDNSGTVQVADDATQTGLTDNSINDSYNNEGSFNVDVTETDNSIDDSFDAEDSFNVDNSVTDNSVDTQDNDVDVDAGLL
jgi:hypothetical protein